MQAKVLIKNLDAASGEMEAQARALAKAASELDDVRRALKSEYYGVGQALARIRSSVDDERRKMDMLGGGARRIGTEYSRAEAAIVSGIEAGRFESVNASSVYGSQFDIGTWLRELIKTPVSDFGPIALDLIRKYGLPFPNPLFLLGGLTMQQAGYGHSPSGNASSTFGNVEFDNGKVEGSLWKGSAEIEQDSLYAGVNACVGKGEAKFKVEGPSWAQKDKSEYKKGEWEDKSSEKFTVVKAEMGVEGSILAADGKVTAGDDMFGSELKAEGGLGNGKLSGSGELSVGEDGVNVYAKGEALVSAAEGKVSGTINILGLELKGEAGGYAGALGVEGKAGIEDGKLVLKGGAAAGFGGSLGIGIGFNDTGWNNFMDGVDQFVDLITFWD